MTLDLSFWATDEADARRQAREWADAEPNVESARITAAVQISQWGRWTVTAELVLRSDYKALTFWGERVA